VIITMNYIGLCSKHMALLSYFLLSLAPYLIAFAAILSEEEDS
jgi:hypothetical protein